MTDIEQFFDNSTTTPEPQPVTASARTKKRKKPTNDENHTLKKRARFFCKCPEQWRSVSRYSQQRMEQFVQEQEFMNDQAMYDSIFGFAHRVIALAMDTISRGDGYVRDEIEADVSLRQAIESEGSAFVQFLSNRFKIVALTTVDVFNGKRKEIENRPTATLVEECEDEINGEASSQTTDMAGQADWLQQATTTTNDDAPVQDQ